MVLTQILCVFPPSFCPALSFLQLDVYKVCLIIFGEKTADTQSLQIHRHRYTDTQILAHCCTIFLKSSGYQNIDDRHRNPNIHIREIIWLGNQLHRYTDTQILIRRYSFTDTDTQIQKYTDIYTWFLSDLRKFKKSI